MTDKHTTKATRTLSDDDLETLLGDVDFLEVPMGFTSKVMRQIDELPVYETDQTGASVSSSGAIRGDVFQDGKLSPAQQPSWWQWVALIGGGIPALMQVLAFIFSAWNVASLG